jgi:hypothetical protein
MLLFYKYVLRKADDLRSTILNGVQLLHVQKMKRLASPRVFQGRRRLREIKKPDCGVIFSQPGATGKKGMVTNLDACKAAGTMINKKDQVCGCSWSASWEWACSGSWAWNSWA